MKYVSIGKILNFHGIQGEAKVGFSKGQEDFLKNLKNIYIGKDSDYIKMEISSVRFNKSFALIKFKGINSINDLVPYKSCLIYVEESIFKNDLKEDEFLIDDLIGIEVFDLGGKKLGEITSVSNNNAQSLLSIKSISNKISLVPFVKDLVPTVDIKNNKVIVNNIEGLIN